MPELLKAYSSFKQFYDVLVTDLTDCNVYLSCLHCFQMTEEMAQLEKEGQLVKVCHIQEDYRRMADGAYVNSRGRIITYGKAYSTLFA